MAKNTKYTNRKPFEPKGKNRWNSAKYPAFSEPTAAVTDKYPELAECNRRASNLHYRDFKQDQPSWGFSNREVVETSYCNYDIQVSDPRGYITATQLSRSGKPKPWREAFEWEKVGEEWDVFNTYEEAQHYMTETFFYALGSYERIKARIVLTCGGIRWEADIRYYERRRIQK